MDYPKYARIKQAVIANSKSPSSPIDSRNTTAELIERERKLLESSGEPSTDLALESDVGLEEPILSPDDFIDPSALAKAGAKVGMKGVPIAAGVIAQAAKDTRPFKVLGLKIGENFRDVLGKIQASGFDALGSTAIEKSGKSAKDFTKSTIDDVSKKGFEVIQKPSQRLKKELQGGLAAVDSYEKKLYLPNEISDTEGGAGILAHETKHVDELFNKLAGPNDGINYGKLPPEKLAEIKKLFPDVEDFADLKDRIAELMIQGRYAKVASATNVGKMGHFADPNIKDLERDEALKFLYDKSKDSMLPGEIDLLNSVNPRIINPIDIKKQALEKIKKKK
jgi:hypothetical protein